MSKETGNNTKETESLPLDSESSPSTSNISPRTGKPIEKKFHSVDYTKNRKKKKMKPRGGNSPVIGMNGYLLEDGDNNKFTRLNIELFNMKDIDLTNAEEVAQRLSDYFALYAKYDTKPTVAGMAMALNGMDRHTLVNIVKDRPTGGSGYKTALPPEVASVIKKAYNLMENLWENYMVNGKLNPVTGIFLGKNNYGYVDKTETVLTPNTKQDSDYSADEIRERYLPSDSQKRLSDSSDSDESDS